MGCMRSRLRGQTFAPVVDGMRAIEIYIDLHAGFGIGSATGTGTDLEELSVDLDRVVGLDSAFVLERADPLELCLWRRGAPSRVGMSGGSSKARIVPREKVIEHALSLREGRRLGEPQFGDEAILERPEEALDPALGLRRLCRDPSDEQVFQGAADLRGGGSALELFDQRERGAGIAVKDAMAIRVDRGGEAIAPDEVAQKQEVPVSVFIRAKDAAEDFAGGIVDRRVEDQAGPAGFQPGMVTGIQLDEQARLRHAVTTPSMPWRPPRPGTADAGSAENAAHGGTREPQPVALLEQLGELMIVDPGINGTRQGDDPGSNSVGEPARRDAAAVAVGQSRDPLRTQIGQQPTEVTKRQAQKLCGGVSGKCPGLNAGQDVGALLLFLGQGNRLPVHPSRVTDSLNC